MMSMKALAASTALLFALGLGGCGEEVPEDAGELGVTDETPEQDDAFAKQNADRKGAGASEQRQSETGGMTAGEQRDKAIFGDQQQDSMTQKEKPARQNQAAGGASPGGGASGTKRQGEIGAFESDKKGSSQQDKQGPSQQNQSQQ